MINFLRVKWPLWDGGKQKAGQGVGKCRFQSGILLLDTWVTTSNSLKSESQVSESPSSGI